MIDNSRTWSMVRRRGWLIGLIAVSCLCISIALAYTITPLYRSEGRLLVEQGEMPDELVPTTIRGFAEERIEIVRTRVMDEGNLDKVIAEQDLYNSSALSTAQKHRLFRDRSSVVVEELEDGTISFLVAFDDESPARAKSTAEALTTLFQEENVKSRTESASSTAAFLENEANRLTDEIAKFEEQIAGYKENNKGRLPEQVTLNIQFLDRAERELDDVEREIRALQQRREVAEADMARAQAVTGYDTGEAPPPGSAGRLRYLQGEYLRLLTTYSSEHPDIRKIRREIQMLDPDAPILSMPVIEEQIRVTQEEIVALRNRYSENHPDVISAQRSLERLRDQQNAASDRDGGVAAETDPEIMRLSAIIQGTDREIAALRTQRDNLLEKMSVYESRLTNAPQVQRELLSLTRGYEQLQKKYEDVKLKQTQVELAVTAEEEQRAGRFALISSPRSPDGPAYPNRPALIFLGLLFGVGSGLLTAAAIEASDKSLRDEQDVREAWQGPPLVAVPEILNQSDERARTVRVTAYAVALGLMVSSTAVLVFVQ